MQALHSTITIMENNIVDLHTHILFGIDDGARNLDESLEMAKSWLDQGVKTVVASPHFDVQEDDLEEFLIIRDENHRILMESLKENNLDLEVLLSAELYFRADLSRYDLSPFLIQGTDYLLIELPTRTVPSRIKSTFEDLIYQGYNPVLVHIERYPSLKQDLNLFYELAEMGVVFQVNAETIINGTDSFIDACFKKNYVHLIASDAHRFDSRKPNIKEALELIPKAHYYNENAKKVVENELVESKVSKKINKIFNKYY